MKELLAFSLIALLTLSTIVIVAPFYFDEKTEVAPFYVGVSFCGNTTSDAKLLIDRVKDYTNLFVLQSGPISENETATTEICDYAVGSGLSVIVFFGDLTPRLLQQKDLFWRIPWVNTSKQRWGAQFLGIYYYDEPGGIQVDYNWTEREITRWNVTYDDFTYDAMANIYNTGFQVYDQGFRTAKDSLNDVFVSDYALYWFDYLAGYDVILAQFGWNHTTKQDIALVRGAANLQDKRWGAMVTWKYTEQPYLASGEEIYDQMQMAYESGAEYVAIFNYAPDMTGSYGTLQPEHFDALERFWNEVVQNPAVVHGGIKADSVLVLPRNYGWGMRHPDDKIWGLWGPDEKSPQIWQISRQLLSRYGISLDIVYEDSAFPVEGKYARVYYWNQTVNSS